MQVYSEEEIEVMQRFLEEFKLDDCLELQEYTIKQMLNKEEHQAQLKM